MKPYIFIAVLLLLAVLQLAVSEEPHVNPDTNSFESLGTVGMDILDDGDSANDVVVEGDGYKITSITCEGDKCRKTKKGEQVNQQPKDARTGKIQFEPVRKVTQTNKKRDMYPELQKANVPTIVQGSTVVDEWPAFKDWTWNYFVNMWESEYIFHPILVSNSTLPGYATQIVLYKNMSKESSWPNVPKPYTETAMRLGNFFSGQCGKTTPESWWYSKPLIALNDDQVNEDTSPRDFFVDKQAVFERTNGSRDGSDPLILSTEPDIWMNLVMGSREAVMHLHYDVDDSWIVQVHRRQQVLLFSPKDMLQLYLFPYAHPHAHRSQVIPLTEATDKDFPGISKVKGQEAMLEEGDILFIPKYWGYHIINLDPGISVHVVSPNYLGLTSSKAIKRSHMHFNAFGEHRRLTTAHTALKRGLEAPVRFLKDELTAMVKEWRIEKARQEGKDVSKMLDKNYEIELTDKQLLRAYLRNHINQRYSKLPRYPSATGQTPEYQKQLVKDFCKQIDTPKYGTRLDTKQFISLSVFVDQIVETWSYIRDLDVRHLIIADWVDHVAYGAFEDHELAEIFLRKCF